MNIWSSLYSSQESSSPWRQAPASALAPCSECTYSINQGTVASTLVARTDKVIEW